MKGYYFIIALSFIVISSFIIPSFAQEPPPGQPQGPEIPDGFTPELSPETEAYSGTEAYFEPEPSPEVESYPEPTEEEQPLEPEIDIEQQLLPIKEIKEDETISLDLRGINIIELFKVLSQKSGLNIVPSSKVRGRVNIFLNNVTVEDVIEIILISQDLACERKGNILYVVTAQEYKEIFGKKYYEKRKFKVFKLQYASPKAVFNVFSQIKTDIGKIIVEEGSATVIVVDIPEAIKKMEIALSRLDQPLPYQTFNLNYAQAEDVQTEIAKILTPGPSIMQIDKRTNKLVVRDLPEKMKLVKDIMFAFDESPKQVFIEAEIIQVYLDESIQTGINWDKVFSDLKYHSLTFGGDFVGTIPLETLSLGASPAQMSVGTLADDDYNVLMEFIEATVHTNVLSRPRIAVLNNEEAKILIGTREAYVTGTLSQGETSVVTSESIEFVDVGVKLNVIPSISNDGFVIMQIKPEVSTVVDVLTTETLGSRIPIVETSEAETVVKVKDGSMIMIGGLIKKEKYKKREGVPFLSKVPILNLFFSAKYDRTAKTELVIFLRPRIITGEVPHLAEAVPGERVVMQRPLKGFAR